MASAAMHLCTHCFEGIVRATAHGFGQCPVCAVEHDTACLPPLHTNREGAALLFAHRKEWSA